MTSSGHDGSSGILLSVGGLLHREIAIDDLLKRLVDRIADAMRADRGTIYLVDRRKREVFSKVAHLPELEEIRLHLGQGVAGFVAETGKPVNVPTASTEARFFSGVDEKTGYHTESILAVPMRDRAGEIIGVVQLLNKRGGPFPREDEVTLAGLAEQAALAIEATTLYEDLARGTGDDDRGPTPEESFPLGARFNLIVGDSEPLRQACRLTRKAAATEATVLVRGESGTGKELFARAIHVNSPRRDGPFVKVDCAALPESLIENELFGHERGAYTGADQRALGKFDAARGGTIFLDEIGELPLAVQGKLLRVLQDREFERVGGTKVERADVRVVAATNRNLQRLVAEGRFRGDLYYRIKVVEVVLPALRERGAGDVVRLAQHFAALAAKRHGRPVPKMPAATVDRLLAYPWPGNVRELENCLESAVVIMEGDAITPEDLPLADRPGGAQPGAVGPADVWSPHAPPPLEPATLFHGTSALQDRARDERVKTLDEVEEAHIRAVLARAAGNRTLAAKLLGIGRNTLARKLTKYGL
ncbi:sigma 54-interacting transcriptional regulator [Myxococcota bacterium]|nr:sigma 54-interacting transcriptional regulator [Myxococcota bacterium]